PRRHAALAKAERSREVTREFQHLHPCPSTGKRTGTCPGYVKDHVVPLCAEGADTVANIQWQTIAEAKEKDRWERETCRAALHGQKSPVPSTLPIQHSLPTPRCRLRAKP